MNRAKITKLRENDYASTEALNQICSNFIFAGQEYKKVLLTSCIASEGKSFMSIQIMQNLAKRGRRVVIVDADLRRSQMVKTYGIELEGDKNGLVHYLAGYCPAEEVLYETNIQNAYLIPVGRDVVNPIPLLTSKRFSSLLDSLAEQFDYVIVDAPPVGLVVDAAEIARFCDGALFIVSYNMTRRRDLQEAKNQMMRSGCPIIGCIINQVTFESLSAKKYYNKSYYSHYNDEYYARGSRPEKTGKR